MSSPCPAVGKASDKNMPIQQVNTSYLQGSHFTLSQEESWTPWTRMSTFKKDYVPYNVEDKPPGANPKEPAKIFNKDERFFNNNHSASETLAEFQPKPFSKKATYDTNKLRRTNFKMDSDHRQPEPYLSIQKTSYLPKDGDFSKVQPKLDTTTSSILQGDREKAPPPLSDYRDRFRGVSTDRLPPTKATSGPSTIRGDNRTHGYETTHQDNFTGKWQLPAIPVAAHRSSSIPQGDLEKERRHRTEFQTAYEPHSDIKGYDPSAVTNMQKTQFRLDDGHNFYNDYGTTMKTAYVPKDVVVERSSMGEKRNHSDVPEGDMDKWRQAQRGGTTTYHWDMQPPPHDFQKEPKVDGGSIRTRSQVPFGDEAQNNDFYKTTNQEVYVPQNGRPASSDTSAQGLSSIPLDYYSGGIQGTTTQKTDFTDPEKGRELMNEQALERIKRSNIRAPLGASRFFSTTHRDHFIPLTLEEGVSIDATKLQKSSVPLGTLNG
ncbi:stabilizer of axonemal microtubules 5-like [Watersipora subatra]|uniref:stabilizer of axonemal microtubules 5-like n=1 Tax=Watersipora subatra TaxID=2589382 RepID=UPI00355B82C8